MPGFVNHVGAVGMCPHAGQTSILPGNARVLASGQPIATLTDTTTVAACPFQVPIPAGTKPQPCVQVRWMANATRVFAGGAPVLLSNSPGACLSAESIPQGPPTMLLTQLRVMAT